MWSLPFLLQDLPGVQVTLVHGGSQLLSSLPARLGAAAEAWLTSKGCKVRGAEGSWDTDSYTVRAA